MSGGPEGAMEVVVLAIEIEQRCALLYREWAWRFHPYDPGIGGLLEELAREEREHEREFRALQEEIAAGEAPAIAALPPEFTACMSRLETIRDHFFVVGPVMAATILEVALEIEYFTRRLYEDLASRSEDPAVAALCRRLSEYEEGHARILMERLEFERQKLTPD